MRVSTVLAAVPFLFSQAALALPTEYEGELAARAPPPSPPPMKPKPKPQNFGGKADALGSAVEQVIQIWMDAAAKDRDMEPRFTQGVVDDLAKKNPGKNVIIFHAQCSKTNFKNSQHKHVEVNLATSGTKGYEILIFESGTFDLCGDGGFRNWAFSGCVKNRNGGHVEFNKC